MNAVVEVAKSAVGSFVGVLTGERKKSSTSRRGPRRKKPASKGAASKRGEAKRSARGRRSAVSSRKATRKSATKRAKAKRPSTRRTSSPAASRRSAQKATTTRATRKSPQAKRSEAPRKVVALSLGDDQLGVAHAERNANWWLEIAQSKRGPLGSGPSWVDEVQGTLINPLRPQAEAPLESITPGENESSFHPGPQFWASWGRLRDLTRASMTLAAHSVKPRPRCATPSARAA